MLMKQMKKRIRERAQLKQKGSPLKRVCIAPQEDRPSKKQLVDAFSKHSRFKS